MLTHAHTQVHQAASAGGHAAWQWCCSRKHTSYYRCFLSKSLSPYRTVFPRATTTGLRLWESRPFTFGGCLTQAHSGSSQRDDHTADAHMALGEAPAATSRRNPSVSKATGDTLTPREQRVARLLLRKHMRCPTWHLVRVPYGRCKVLRVVRACATPVWQCSAILPHWPK